MQIEISWLLRGIRFPLKDVDLLKIMSFITIIQDLDSVFKEFSCIPVSKVKDGSGT